jgi:hypothetical protein
MKCPHLALIPESRVEDLIAAGCDVNAFDDGMRYTPLHYA